MQLNKDILTKEKPNKDIIKYPFHSYPFLSLNPFPLDEGITDGAGKERKRQKKQHLQCYAVERHFRGGEYKTLTHLCFAPAKPHKIKRNSPLNANIGHDKLRAKAVCCFRPPDYSQAKTEKTVRDAKRTVYP